MDSWFNKPEIVPQKTTPVKSVLDHFFSSDKGSSGIEFHYSSTTIIQNGNSTHIDIKRQSYKNGELKSEEFSGTKPGNGFGDLETRLLDQFKSHFKFIE